MAALTEASFGRRIRPWMAPLAAVPLFRAIAALDRRLGASEFMPVRMDEAPLDYEFLKTVGYRIPPESPAR